MSTERAPEAPYNDIEQHWLVEYAEEHGLDPDADATIRAWRGHADATREDDAVGRAGG